MTCGVYMLYWEEVPQVYIGQSLGIEGRYVDHLWGLRTGNHTDKMLSMYHAYGNPLLEILEICNDSLELNMLEVYHIKLWNAVKDGLNYISQPGVPADGHPKGEKLANSTCSDAEIIDLVKYIISNRNKSLQEVSINKNIPYSVIKSICCGETYKWLVDVIPEEYTSLMQMKGKKVTQGSRGLYTIDQIETTFKTLVNSVGVLTTYQISEICGVSTGVVYNIRNSNNYLWLKDRYPEEFVLLHKKLGHI